MPGAQTIDTWTGRRITRAIVVLSLFISFLYAATPQATALVVTVSFQDASSSSLAESGAHTVGVVLNSDGGPTAADITVSVADAGSGDATATSDYSFTTTSLTFPAGSGNGTVLQATVTILPDDVSEDDETVDLELTVTDPGLDVATLAAPAAHQVTIVDDDVPGVSLSTAVLSVTEGQPGKVYSLVLDSEPTNNVRVDISPTTDEAEVTPAFVSFNTNNWDSPKDVTVTAVDDAIVDGMTSDELDHAVTSSDASYGGLAVASTAVTVFDNDVAPMGNPDFYNVSEGGTLVADGDEGVLGNDTGAGGAILIAGPAHHVGGFSLNLDGSFSYTHDGSAPDSDTFTYRAIDGVGNQSADTLVTITINNVAPNVIGGADPAPVAEGVNVAVNATFTDPGLGDVHTATINWGDGTVHDCSTPACTITFNAGTGAGTVTGSHSFAAVGVYPVMITVDDGDDTGSDSVTVTVQNANLTVNGGTIAEIDEGDVATLNASFVDADGKGVHVASVNWGDGTIVSCATNACTIVDNGNGTGTVTGSHRYDDDGDFSVVITVSDGSGDTGSGGATATVRNVAPQAQITDTAFNPLPNSSTGGREGVLLRLRSTVQDPGDEDFDYDWTIRSSAANGQIVATGSNDRINYRALENGTYSVALNVDDQDGGAGVDSVLIIVNNAAPVITAVNFDATPTIGANATMAVHFTDAGTSDTHTTTVAWGEGSPQSKAGTSPRFFGHTYNSAGTRSALVCVTDDDGGEDCESMYVNPGVSFSIDSDFNGDGYEDLPIGVPGEDGFGAVNVLYGTSSGLGVAGDDVWKQGVDGIAGNGEAGDRFGAVLAWGDFNLDGFSDLVVAAPTENLGAFVDTGVIHVIYGSSTGLSASGDRIFHQSTPGLAGANQSGDRYGDALAVGDYNGDGFADLAVGVPGEDVAGIANAGRVAILFGSPAGLRVTGNESWHQNDPGVIGVNAAGDSLGAALAAGDFDRDGKWDLVIGIPGKNAAGKQDSGAVLVMGGSILGLDVTADQWWHQDVGTMKNTADPNDRFGSVLEVGDFNGDARADLAIGIPKESYVNFPFAGGVAVMLSGNNGLSDDGNTMWHEAVPGLIGSVKRNDRFGFALAAGDFDNDGRDDLAIGVPFQETGGKSNAGDVAVLYGGSSGLTVAGNQRWNENSPGIKGTSGRHDHLGWALRAFDMGADGDADLAIGIPDQNIAGDGNAGAVLVIKGRPGGLSSIGDLYWHQDTPGVREVTGPNDRFGKAL